MTTTRLALTGAGCLVVAAVAWMLLRPADSAQSVSRSAPSKTSAMPAAAVTGKATEPRALLSAGVATQSTHAQTAKATFETSRDCYFAQNHVYAVNSVIHACQSLPQIPETESQRAACSSNIERSRAEIRELSDALDACPEGTGSARSFYEATKAAAAQGDAEAQACYVQSLYQSNGVDLTYSQQDIDDYRRDAPRYIASGLSRGDWRIVALLARGGHGDQYNLLELITRDDVYTQYVMNRLLQLGADVAYATQLDRSIQAIYLAPRMTQGPPLTQEQIARGSKEALDLFHRSFDRQALLQGPPMICARK